MTPFPKINTQLFCSFLVCFISIILFSKNAQAQTDNATLRIIVISEDDGISVIGANIVLTDMTGDTLNTGVSDVDGFKEFKNIDPGPYKVSISYIGYENLQENITLDPGETLILRPALKTSTYQIEEVLISVKRGAASREAGKQTITVDDIKLVPSPGPGGDLSMYLQTLPGVVTPGDKGGELFIRGGTPSQNLILVDNMPVVKPFHISNLFSAFPQEAINSADIYAGGFGAEYIGATSSVLDVSLRQGNMRQFESTVSASPYLASFQAEGPLSRDNTSLMFIGRHSAIEETAPSLSGEEVPLLFSDMLARFSVNWDGFSCSVTGLYTYDRGRINPTRNIDLKWSNSATGLRCLGYGEDLSHTLDLTMGYSGFNSSEFGFDDIGRESNVKMGYLRLDNGGVIFGLPMDFGFRWNLTMYDAQLDEPFPELTGANVRYADLESSFEVLESIFSGYFTVNWSPNENVTIMPGVATQNRHRDMKLTLEPRLRMTWQPNGTERQEINLAAGRYIQMMEGITDERDAGTVFYVYKPVELDTPLPEAWHGIVGYRRQIGEKVQASLESYIKLQSNIPVSEWTQEPGNTIRTARAEAITYGADLQLELNLFPLYMSMGYGYSEVTYEASADELVSWLNQDKFSYNPNHDIRHQLNVIASYELAGFTANASWRFSSGAPYTRIFAFDFALPNDPDQDPLNQQGTARSLYSEPFDGRLPSFHRLDVSLSRIFSLLPGLAIEAEVGAINTYNIRNVFYYDVNTFEQVDQSPLLPYVSVSARINH